MTGQRYHGVIKADNGLSYWAVYEKDGRRVSLEPCEVHDFTDLLPSGIIVDAAANHDNQVYVAYRSPVLPGQTQPVDSMLAMLTLSAEGQPQLVAADFVMVPDDRITGLSVDGNDVLVNTRQSIYRLSEDNDLMILPARYDFSPNEVILSVAGSSVEHYLLTHEQDAGYRIRVVPESGVDASFMVTTPSGVTTSGQVTPSLKISGDWLHLLMIDGRSIIWRKYRLKTLASALDEAKESEAYAALPQNITAAAITLIPDMVVDTDQVFIMGENTSGQPQYFRLKSTDFTPLLKGVHGIANWPWWGKVLLGTGTGLTGIALLTATSCLLKKAWSCYQNSGIKAYKLDSQHKHDLSQPRDPFDYNPQPSAPPLFDLGGSSPAMQMTPVATGLVQKFQTCEEAHICEIIDSATGVTQAEAELPGNTLDHREAYELWPGPIKIHQLPKQAH